MEKYEIQQVAETTGAFAISSTIIDGNFDLEENAVHTAIGAVYEFYTTTDLPKLSNTVGDPWESLQHFLFIYGTRSLFRWEIKKLPHYLLASIIKFGFDRATRTKEEIDFSVKYSTGLNEFKKPWDQMSPAEKEMTYFTAIREEKDVKDLNKWSNARSDKFKGSINEKRTAYLANGYALVKLEYNKDFDYNKHKKEWAESYFAADDSLDSVEQVYDLYYSGQGPE